MSKNESEPLLADNPNRYVMFPLQDHDIWSLYKKMFDCMWRAEEIDLSKDLVHWKTLNSNEQHFIKMILAFFAASDGIVLENLGMRFLSEVQLPEARAAYGFQLMMENVHSETYSLLIDTYIKDSTEKKKLFEALDNFSCIKKKADWAIKWINDKRSSFARLAFLVYLYPPNKEELDEFAAQPQPPPLILVFLPPRTLRVLLFLPPLNFLLPPLLLDVLVLLVVEHEAPIIHYR